MNLYQFAFHDFPISAGMLEPIDFAIEHGTVLDPDTEAAISCSPLTASVTFPLLGVTFSKMMFDSPQRDLGVWLRGLKLGRADDLLHQSARRQGD